jgi:hypothetical protein
MAALRLATIERMPGLAEQDAYHWLCLARHEGLSKGQTQPYTSVTVETLSPDRQLALAASDGAVACNWQDREEAGHLLWLSEGRSHHDMKPFLLWTSLH